MARTGPEEDVYDSRYLVSIHLSPCPCGTHSPLSSVANGCQAPSQLSHGPVTPHGSVGIGLSSDPLGATVNSLGLFQGSIPRTNRKKLDDLQQSDTRSDRRDRRPGSLFCLIMHLR